jgi:hypothetical protein
VRTAAIAVALATALLAGGFAKADPTCAIGCSGTIQNAWIAPSSGELLNSAAGNGTFGYTVDPGTIAAWAGKSFRLTYPSTTADLDIYFYVPSRDDDKWDFTGVNEGPGRPEQGYIPAGTQRAFVVIAVTTANETAVPFTLTVQ